MSTIRLSTLLICYLNYDATSWRCHYDRKTDSIFALPSTRPCEALNEKVKCSDCPCSYTARKCLYRITSEYKGHFVPVPHFGPVERFQFLYRFAQSLSDPVLQGNMLEGLKSSSWYPETLNCVAVSEKPDMMDVMALALRDTALDNIISWASTNEVKYDDERSPASDMFLGFDPDNINVIPVQGSPNLFPSIIFGGK